MIYLTNHGYPDGDADTRRAVDWLDLVPLLDIQYLLFNNQDTVADHQIFLPTSGRQLSAIIRGRATVPSLTRE